MSKQQNEIFDLISTGLDDAIRFHKGEKRRGRLRHVEFIDVAVFDAARIKRLRSRLLLSQERMSALLGVSKDTIKKWETGDNQPMASNARLLQMLEANPEIFLSTFEKRA